MTRFALPALVLCAAPVLLAPSFQTRVRPDEPEDFGTIIAAAKSDWDAEKYGACLANLQKATLLATEKRADKIKGALPQAPAGWSMVPEKKKGNAGALPGMGALTAMAGNIIERRWNRDEGAGSVTATVHADSPMVSMLGMVLGNPAMLGEGKELIEYGKHKAILETRKKDEQYQLQIVIDEKHLVDVSARGIDEDGLFGMFDQQCVDRLSSALSL